MSEQVFVTRERELAQLNEFLDTALAGQGTVCFVTGEAGSGKTALVTEFARRAQDAHADLLVAIGDCNAQTGIGDPYLPFREILAQLTGDVEAGVVTRENAGRLQSFLRESGKALVELGPDLIDVFVPGAGVATRAATLLAGRLGWTEQLQQLTQREATGDAGPSTSSGRGLEQQHIFEQYARVLKAMSAHQPLVLMIDDLQWADADSVGLLFHLGRRIGDGRILILGAYRPDELALGRGTERHPLEKVLAEFKRYFGDVWVNLGEAREVEGRNFVDRLVDTEPNDLGEAFRRALYHHTGGHALFTVELLRDMQERGDLIHDEEGRWVEGPQLDWKRLPARVEGVIEERIGRLEQELRDILTVASVEGENFTAEVVARVGAADERNLVRRLSRELDRQHRLVSAKGVRRVGRQRLSLYRFQHNLFQQYLYHSLDEIERSFLHEDAGNVLEELYGDQVEEIAVQLARHFEEAGVDEKARHYLKQAGERARRQYANEEAVNYLSRALALTPETDYEERYALLLAREKVYDVQGAREIQRQDLAALERLAEALADDQRQAEVALRWANYAEVTGDYAAAIGAAQEAIDLARTSQISSLEATGYLQLGRLLWYQADYQAARTQLERALALAQTTQLRQVAAKSLGNLGNVSHDLGEYAGARAYYEQALGIYREIGNRRGEGASLLNLGAVYHLQCDFSEAREYYQQALGIYREIGDRWGESLALSNLGSVAKEQGDYAGAKSQYEQALRIKREIGARQSEAITLENLGSVALQQGDYAGARAFYEQALRLFREIGDRRSESDTLANLGLLFHRSGDNEAALDYSRQALLVAQSLGARHEQGLALTHLGHALLGLGRADQAADAYRQALRLRRETSQHHLAMEPLAGLAHISMSQGILGDAQASVEKILSYLETRTLEGTNEPVWIYLTCYRVLRANQDPRAQDVLRTAYSLLQERAARITDEEMRRSFLENVPAHRELLHEFAVIKKEETLCSHE